MANVDVEGAPTEEVAPAHVTVAIASVPVTVGESEAEADVDVASDEEVAPAHVAVAVVSLPVTVSDPESEVDIIDLTSEADEEGPIDGQEYFDSQPPTCNGVISWSARYRTS